MSDIRIDVIKDIGTGILSASALLLTIILGFVIPSTRDKLTIQDATHAAYTFLAASLCAIVSLSFLIFHGSELPPRDSVRAPTEETFAFLSLVAMFFGIVFLTIAISRVLP